VIGAGFIVTLQNELADRAGPWVTVIMGVIFVVCVLLFRRGIVGEVVGRLKPINHGDTENTEKSNLDLPHRHRCPHHRCHSLPFKGRCYEGLAKSSFLE